MLQSETSPLDVTAIRRDFPILNREIRPGTPLIYLDNAATSQRPSQVIQSLVDVYERKYANVHRGIHWLSEQSTDLYEEARERVRRFIGAAHRQEVIFTTGTTASINLVATSWGGQNVGEGDEILLTEMEHHSNIVPWFQLAERTGCVVRFLPITDDGFLQLDRLSEFLTERTKLFAVSAISNVLGVVNPVGELVERAHAVGAKILIDAAQSIPHARTDVTETDADFLAFSGHKMLGPSGVGVLYGKKALLDAMPPFLGGGSMIRRVTLEGFESAELPAKFEAGTPPIVSALGLTAAIDYLEQIGLDNIAQHEQLLCQAAHTRMADIDGVRFIGPEPDRKAGIVSFTLDGVHAHDVAQVLDRSGVAIRAGHHCTMPLHKRLGVTASNRASFYLYNTLDEVEMFVEGLQRVKQTFRRRRRKRSVE